MTTFPETIIPTPVGNLRVWATSGQHVGISTEGYALDQGRKRRPFDSTITPDEWETIATHATLSRVDYLVRFDLEPAAADGPMAGGWIVQSAYLSRVRGMQGPTPAAGKAAHANIVVPLIQWLATDDGKALVAEADRRARESAIRTAEADLAAAEARVAKVRADLAELEASR